jgi:hypothetical protein
LEPLLKFIDLRRIEDQILSDIIEPLGIIPTEMIQRKIKLNNSSDLSDIRGTNYFGIIRHVDQNLLLRIIGKLYMHQMIVVNFKVSGLK